MGRSEAAALRSASVHRHASAHDDRSTREADSELGKTISRQRLNIEVVLDDDPGLVPRRQAQFEQAYRIAWREASIETPLPLKSFPLASAFTREKVERETYWPPRPV